MRPALGVALGLCALPGCFSDDPPELTAPADPSTGTTTSSSSSTSTSTSTSSSSSTSSEPTTGPDPTESTTGPCPMGQPERAWYLDRDGDGFGAGETEFFACAAPPGAVEKAGDCDDAAFEVHPDAVEQCNDLVDDDCDGLLDEYSPDNSACGGCSLSEFGGNAFWICDGPLDFLAAEARCQQFGAAVHLARPINAAELGFVRDRIFAHLSEQPLNLHFWLGLHRVEALWGSCDLHPEASDWVALDGEPVTYLPWRDGEPNNAECPLDCASDLLHDPLCIRENCVAILDAPTGAYGDVSCGNASPGLVCKAPLPR